MLNKYNETLANLNNLTLFEIQKAYMQIVGQINEHGGVLVPADYFRFTKTEIAEFFTAYVKNDKLEMLDALCDIVVCALGWLITVGARYHKEDKSGMGFWSESSWVREIITFSIEQFCSSDKIHKLIYCVYLFGERNFGRYTEDFDKALLEVFRNNFARLQFDENGNVLKQPEFLADGSKNPDAGKVVKKPNLNPDLKQFLTR